jgi:hypothetical protein
MEKGIEFEDCGEECPTLPEGSTLLPSQPKSP